MILRGLQRCLMPINAPYTEETLFEVWRRDPRPVEVDGVVRVHTIFRLEESRRLSSGDRVLASATSLGVIRFPKQQLVHGAVAMGLPAPMWVVEVDRQYEAGWVISREVASIDNEAEKYRNEVAARDDAKGKGPARGELPLREFRDMRTELAVIEAVAARLNGRVVDRYINPVHQNAKLRMVNLFEGWPHIEEIRQWLNTPHDADAQREAGAHAYRQMQAFHGTQGATNGKAGAE